MEQENCIYIISFFIVLGCGASPKVSTSSPPPPPPPKGIATFMLLDPPSLQIHLYIAVLLGGGGPVTPRTPARPPYPAMPICTLILLCTM